MAARTLTVAITLLAAASIAAAETLHRCPVEPAPDQEVQRGALGGGMAGDGWDGSGQGSATVYWHVEGTTNDLGAGQRTALINAMQAWADVVDIDFIELAVPNWTTSIDFNFVTGDHCDIESAECGDGDCPFDGVGGVIGHAGFPPGVNAQCPGVVSESMAGNVHFDDAELFEEDTGNATALSLTLLAAHEIGHAIGLTHDFGGGGPHIMTSGMNASTPMQPPSASDIANIRSGYATGVGQVLTLNDTGIWVDGSWTWIENGTPVTPFNTIAEAAAGIPPFTADVVVHVESGAYDEVITIGEPMVLRAEGGDVTIGSPVLRAAAAELEIE